MLSANLLERVAVTGTNAAAGSEGELAPADLDPRCLPDRKFHVFLGGANGQAPFLGATPTHLRPPADRAKRPRCNLSSALSLASPAPTQTLAPS